MKKKIFYILAVLLVGLFIGIYAKQVENKSNENVNEKTGFSGVELEASDIQTTPEKDAIVEKDKQDSTHSTEQTDENDTRGSTENKEDSDSNSSSEESKDYQFEKNTVHDNLIEAPKHDSSIDL